jgi:hypothetical protein
MSGLNPSHALARDAVTAAFVRPDGMLASTKPKMLRQKI